MVRKPTKLSDIEKDTYGQALNRNKRLEEWVNTAKEMEQDVKDIGFSYKELPEGGFQIVITPSHIKTVVSSFIERGTDPNVTAEKIAKQRGLTIEQFEQEAGMTADQFNQGVPAVRELFIKNSCDRAIGVFLNNLKTLANHMVFNMYCLVQARSNASNCNELEVTQGKGFIDISNKDWAENLAYGYEIKVKELLGVELGRPKETYSYIDKEEFITNLEIAADRLLQRNEKISQQTVCEAMEISENTFKNTCARFELNYEQVMVDLKIRFKKKSGK